MPMGANDWWNDGSIRPAEWRCNGSETAPKPQRLHQRLGHINRTLHADFDKAISLGKKNINNLHKINFCFMKKKLHFVEKICIWLLAQHSTVIHNKQYTTQQTIHNTKYIVVIWFPLKHFMAVFGEEAVEQFVDSDRRWLLVLGLDAQSLLYIRHIRNWIYDGRLSRPPSASSKFRI